MTNTGMGEGVGDGGGGGGTNNTIRVTNTELDYTKHPTNNQINKIILNEEPAKRN